MLDEGGYFGTGPNRCLLNKAVPTGAAAKVSYIFFAFFDCIIVSFNDVRWEGCVPVVFGRLNVLFKLLGK